MSWKQLHKCLETVAKPVYGGGEPVERPGEQESLMDEIAAQREQFGDFERSVLIFEEEWARTHPRSGHANSGPKLAAIREVFPEISTTRYYQVLNRLLDMDEAEAHKPDLVHTLRARRDKARKVRDAQTAVAQRLREELHGPTPTREEDRQVATSLYERCEMLAGMLIKAGLRAKEGGSGPGGAPVHVVVRTGVEADGYYRLVPGVGEAVTLYFVPVEGPARDLGHVLSHARAAGVVLDHIAGVPS
jgi:hypothetical protein